MFKTLFNPQPNNFPQRNSDLPSDRRESVADKRELICVSSKSVEFLSSANGNRGSSKFKVIIKSKGHWNKYRPASFFFQATNKTIGSATHRTYFCTNYEKTFIKCNLSNIIHWITSSNCFMQYVGENYQQPNIRFAVHRVSMSGKIKSIF